MTEKEIGELRFRNYEEIVAYLAESVLDVCGQKYDKAMTLLGDAQMYILRTYDTGTYQDLLERIDKAKRRK